MRPFLATSVVGLDFQLLGDQLVQLRPARRARCARLDSLTPPTVVLPPEGPLAGYFELPMLTLMADDRQAKRFGQHHGDDRARAGAQVLAAQEGFDAAVGMDLDQAARADGRRRPRCEWPCPAQ